MRPLMIAHISDLHLHGQYRWENIRKTKRLLEYISRKQVDHLVVTGDITSNADVHGCDLGRSLFAGVGLLDTTRLSVVIGNHDIYGGAHTAEDILMFPHRCRTTDYDAKVTEFREHYQETFERCIVASQPRVFPSAKLVGDALIVGLNSIARYSGIKNPLGANGKIDDR